MNISKIKKLKWVIVLMVIILLMFFNTFFGLLSYKNIPEINHYIQGTLLVAGLYAAYKVTNNPKDTKRRR